MLPQIKGTYRAVARGAWLIDVESSGNVQIGVNFEVTEGEFAGEHIAWTGTFAQGKATDIALKALRDGLGWQGDDLTELADIGEAEAATLLPNAADIVCDMDEYNGEHRLRVKWVNSPGGQRFGTPLVGNKLKAFAAQMRGTIRSTGGPPAQKKPAAKPPIAPTREPGSDEDIPF